MDNTADQNRKLAIFAKISWFEGISFLVLLLIAMPLKWVFEMPLAVKYVGWAHGALFIAYAFQLIYVGLTYKWKFSKIALYGVCSLVPIAPFWVEKKVKAEMKTLVSD
ncbi:MAG: DUF3817 domain-containing protein [Flavobacteriales bacterium]|nr:DUF3817 domain-containing protein [Flavobacteriales bacterium]